MNDQLPILILLCTLFGALFTALVGLVRPRWCHGVALTAVALALACAVATLGEVAVAGQPIEYRIGGWAPPFGIQYLVDPMNAMVAVVIAAVALIAILPSRQALGELREQEGYFYPLALLLVTGLLGMTLTGDAFNLYVLLEITSLSSYALIAIGRGRAAASCLQYIVMGTIGASFYLLGIGYLYIKTGTLNMADLRLILAENDLYSSPTVITSFILMMVGLWIKMGLFPLHGWLPNAYAFAPNATSNLIAPLMTKVSVYIGLRIMLSIYTIDFIATHLSWSHVAVAIATLAILAGSLMAFAQTDLKKMLCYLVVAEVGYMVGGMWLLNGQGFKGTIFHIASDALMTVCLFLCAAIVYWKSGTRHVHAFRGAFTRMPWTMAAFTAAGFSMIGVPPTCGFFSKWYLVTAGIEVGQWHYVAALLVSSLVNAVIFFRIIEIAYFRDVSHPADAAMGKVELRRFGRMEAPPSMLVPLYVGVFGLVILGVFADLVGDWIQRFLVSAGVS